jgi:hypothetical protein
MKSFIINMISVSVTIILRNRLLYLFACWICYCRYDVFRDDSGTEIGGLVLHPKFIVPYVIVNGYRYIASADAHKLFAGCIRNCRILRNVLKNGHGLQFTYCTWEQVGEFYEQMRYQYRIYSTVSRYIRS